MEGSYGKQGQSAPQSIITQVSRDDSYSQVQYEEEDKAVEVVQPVRKEKSFLEKLCCCFFRDPMPISQQEVPMVGVYRIHRICSAAKFLIGMLQGLAHDVAITSGANTEQIPLLPPCPPHLAGRRCLVLDLDETLVHSSFKPIPNPDFIIPVEIEEQVHKVYVLKRPGVDQFLQQMGKLYEVVVFTASLSKYADPVLDLLDTSRSVHYRLFREACTLFKGNFVKDLSRLGRELKYTLIIDNSPTSFLFHPENAIPCETWYDDQNDRELLEMIPVLRALTKADNVCTYLDSIRTNDGRVDYSRAS